MAYSINQNHEELIVELSSSWQAGDFNQLSQGNLSDKQKSVSLLTTQFLGVPLLITFHRLKKNVRKGNNLIRIGREIIP